MFTLHPKLQQDCILLKELALCSLLLMNDANYPWFILVPRREGITEIYQLSLSDQYQLLQESNQVSQFLVKTFQPTKLNIAALGNVVPQLHIHHIARYTTDPAWPAPVWGKISAMAYTEEQIEKIRQLFSYSFSHFMGEG